MESALDAALSAIRLYTTGRGSEAGVYSSAALVSSSIATGSSAAHEELERVDLVDSAQLAEELRDECNDDLGNVDSHAARKSFVSNRSDALADAIQEYSEVTELLTWGKSANYQLGYICTQQEQPLPRSVPKATDIKSLACGRFHSIAVAACGSVFAWGFGGTSSRLGVEGMEGSLPFLVEPVRLPEFGPDRHCAGKAAAGLNHSMALTVHGKVFAWGSNSHGQLGIQGTPIGPDARAKRPVIVKSTLKSEEVVDIAAGAEHSICATAKGSVFAWGSNASGGLGLGAPPSGPTELSQPQQLPHVRGAYSVVAASTGHVSIVLVAHGDAMIFGSLSGQVDGNSRPGAASDTFYLPSRVRRREHKDSFEEDWQLQRGASSSSSSLSPIQRVALTSEDAYGVDAEGQLWTWTLRRRPCFAELVVTSSVGCGWTSVAAGAEDVWAIDRSPAASLWCLRRTVADQRTGESTPWVAERSEHVGQAAQITCSPEHTAVLVKYKRPIPPSASCQAGVVATNRSDDSGEEDSDEDAHARCNKIYNPLPLQQICENRLLQQLSPQSFALVGEIAWEFRRPELLDCAYSFLHANAPLMFSRLNISAIARLPLEVLAAFEMTAKGAISSPSLALLMDPYDFPPPEWLEESGAYPSQQSVGVLGDLEGGSGSSNAPSRATVQVRKRRRGGRGGDGAGGGAGSSTNAPRKSPVQSANRPHGPSPAMSSSPSHPPHGLASPLPAAMHKSPSLVGKVSPTLAPVSEKTSPNLGPQAGADISGSPKSRMPKPVPKKKPVGFQMSDILRPKAPTIAFGANTAHASDAEKSFDLGRARISEGPSSTLVAAAASVSHAEHTPSCQPSEVAEKPIGWVRNDTQGETSVNLRDILTKVPKSQRRSAADNDPTGEKTRCSWGYDATGENTSPKGISIAEAQELEIQQKEEDEIKEIEAMFAAMEASEIEAQFAALEAAQRKAEPKPKKGTTPTSKSRGKDGHNIVSNGSRSEGSVADSKSVKTSADTHKRDWHKKAAWKDQEWSEWWTSSQWWESTPQNPDGELSSRGRGHRGRGGGRHRVVKDGTGEASESVAETNYVTGNEKSWRRKADESRDENSTR